MIEKFTVQQCCVEPTTVAMSILATVRISFHIDNILRNFRSILSMIVVAAPSVDPDVMAASHINAVLTRPAYHAVACLSLVV